MSPVTSTASSGARPRARLAMTARARSARGWPPSRCVSLSWAKTIMLGRSFRSRPRSSPAGHHGRPGGADRGGSTVGVVAEPSTSQMIQPGSGRDTLPAHLEARYGIQVDRLAELDLGVYRVSRRDGSDWVARVFAADRPIAAAEGDAALLRRLE